METLKEAAIETIRRMPDGCSVDDIMYELNVVAHVMDGLRDAEAGDVMTTHELLERVDQWGRSGGPREPQET